MSAGPVEVYNGTAGVANTGGDSLTGDLNIYYSVRSQLALCCGAHRTLTCLCHIRMAISRGS